MNKIAFILLVFFAWHGGIAKEITITNQSGETIHVEPISLEGDSFLFKNEYQRNYTISLSTLSLESQQLVTELFALEQPTANKATSPQAIHPAIKEIKYAGSYVECLTAKERTGDMSSKYPFSELDIESFTIEKGNSTNLHIQIHFAEEMPSKTEFNQPYRIWLRIDLDNDPHTGSPQYGEDIRIAIQGWGKQGEWSSYFWNSHRGRSKS